VVPIYEYRALRTAGDEVTGVVDADTGRDARRKLRDRGVFVTQLAEVRRARTDRQGRLVAALGSFVRRRRTEEVVIITRQCATLVAAGVPLVDVLTVVIDQAGNRRLEIVLHDVRDKVVKGRSLADALALHPEYFSDMYVNMVRAGEASGRLASIFDSLAEYGERRASLKGRVTAALIYPAVLSLVSVAVVLFLVTRVVPRFAGLLARAGKALPLPTAILMGLSSFIREKFWLILLVLVGLVILWKALLRWEPFRRGVDGLKLRLPLIGDLNRKQLVSYFATALGTLLASGIRVSEALGIVRRVMENRVFASAIDELNEEIRAGRDIATTLRGSGVFPPLVSYMIAVGERTGRLEEMLRLIARTYEQEISLTLAKLVAVVEPAIVVVMAGVVAFIVVAILLPILSLSQIAL
jgi:general secretion pathway protein F